jgi:hypothetical protein
MKLRKAVTSYISGSFIANITSHDDSLRLISLSRSCCNVHTVLLFPSQLVEKEPNYIPFDFADGKYKLVLGLKTSEYPSCEKQR